jgi:hypothetical protein
LVRHEAIYFLAVKFNRTLGGPQDAGNRIEEGGFPCPIGANDGNNQGFLNLDGDVPEGMKVVVEDVDVLDSEEGLGH